MNFNLSYKKAYLSRLKFGFNYTYLEHNEFLDESKMQSLKYYGCCCCGRFGTWCR